MKRTLGTVVCCIALVACNPTEDDASASKSVPIRPVKTVTVKSTVNDIRRTYSTVVLPAQEVELSFRVSGRLVELPIRGGANVKKGDVIAQLDKRDFEAEITRLNSQLEQAQAQMSAITSGARAEDVAAQEAAIKGLESNLQTLNDNLSDATLRAPFDGIIADRKVENFSNIQAKYAVATLQALATPNLIFDVPGPDVAILARIQELDLKVVLDSIPGRVFVAKRSEFSTQADPATQTYRGRVSIENPDANLILPGMAGALPVTAQQGGIAALTVPVSAVVSDAGGAPFVWVVSEGDKTVSKQAVNTGAVAGSSITISESLKEGDLIATAGLSALQENMVVKPVTAVGE